MSTPSYSNVEQVREDQEKLAELGKEEVRLRLFSDTTQDRRGLPYKQVVEVEEGNTYYTRPGDIPDVPEGANFRVELEHVDVVWSISLYEKGDYKLDLISQIAERLPGQARQDFQHVLAKYAEIEERTEQHYRQHADEAAQRKRRITREMTT